MTKIIHRYILREVSLPFFMSLFVLTFVLLMGRMIQIMDLVVNKGIQVSDVVKLIIYLTPSFLVFTVPISFLIALLVGVGRLSSDSEMVVLRASGISLYQMLVPVLVMATLAFIMTAANSLFFMPLGNIALRSHLFQIAQKKASIGIRERVFNDDFRGLLLYADHIDIHGEYINNILISDQRLTQEPNTIVAHRAYLIANPRAMKVTLRLENGSIHALEKNMKNYRKIDFKFYDVNLEINSYLPETQANVKKAFNEMTFGELLQVLRRKNTETSDLRTAGIELNKKLSFPLSCFIFAFLGLPLGMKTHRSVKSRGLTLSFVIVLIYYLLQLVGDAMVETGRIDAFIGTWTPNFIFLAAAIVVFFITAWEVRLPKISLRRRLKL
jgi:lipopolysaccharide export system permease protein